MNDNSDTFSLAAECMQPVREGLTIKDFDGSPYGSEFLSFTTGQRIVFDLGSHDEAYAGWALGKLLRTHDEGWFPPAYVQTSTDCIIPSSATGSPLEMSVDLPSHHVPSPPHSPSSASGAKERSAVHEARQSFNGSQYGPGYLSFTVGQRIVIKEAPSGELDAGWAFGELVGTSERGWFPPVYVKTSAANSPLDKPADLPQHHVPSPPRSPSSASRASGIAATSQMRDDDFAVRVHRDLGNAKELSTEVAHEGFAKQSLNGSEHYVAKELSMDTALAIRSFDGSQFGLDYLSFTVGQRIAIKEAPDGEADAGWAFGELVGTSKRGWFPPGYVQTSAEGFPLEKSTDLPPHHVSSPPDSAYSAFGACGAKELSVEAAHARRKGFAKPSFVGGPHSAAKELATEAAQGPREGFATRNFNGNAYGHGYLSFTKGQKLLLLPFSASKGEGWAFGKVEETSEKGWFPPEYWERAHEESTAASSTADASSEESGLSAAQPALASLDVGATVLIYGLQSQLERNGQRGTLMEWMEVKSRWLVQLERGGVLSVRPANLQLYCDDRDPVKLMRLREVIAQLRVYMWTDSTLLFGPGNHPDAHDEFLPPGWSADANAGGKVGDITRQPPARSDLVAVVLSFNDIRGKKSRLQAPKPNVMLWQSWDQKKGEMLGLVLARQREARAIGAEFLMVFCGCWELYESGFCDGFDGHVLRWPEERAEAGQRHDELYQAAVDLFRTNGVPVVWLKHDFDGLKPYDGWHFRYCHGNQVVGRLVAGIRRACSELPALRTALVARAAARTA